MSVKPETTFYTSVLRHLPPPSTLHREKMSNPYRGGTADTWFSGRRQDLWVEWKFVVVPVRDATPVRLGLSELQHDWLRRRYDEGRNVWVVVGCKQGGVRLVDLQWEQPLTAAQFRSQLQSRQELAAQIAHHCL